jgi:hypothetical protein
MSWLTSTACKNPRAASGLAFLLILSLLPMVSSAQDVSLHAPTNAVAGTAVSIGSSGGGSATFYLVGPASVTKHDVQLGQDISVPGKEIQQAGHYVAIACSSNCSSVDFFVAPATPSSLTFLAHPSRVPVGQGDAISGVALAFDKFQNLVLSPATVDFQLTAKGAAPASHSVQTQGGVAWFHTNSGKSAGPVQVVASLQGLSVRRVVQAVASEPCNLRIKGQRSAKGVVVETDPIHDCEGNPVPDGTIVTFTARNGNEVSTVDAPVKQDVARAQIASSGPLVISAASGVVMGNELRMGGR